jgi:hypothetical protein
MQKMTRRHFLKTTASAAGAVAAPWVLPSRCRGAIPANNRITVGLIGKGAMGSGHLQRLVGDPAVQLLAVCEVDAFRRDAAQHAVNTAYAQSQSSGQYSGCSAYNDYREMLARPDIDAILIATPDHWHTLQSIDAVKAGKDVYCEKPVSVTINEGRQLVDAVQRYGRVFQTGTQYRAIPTIRRVVQFVRNGGLGKIKSVFTILDPLKNFVRSLRYESADKAMTDAQAKMYYPTELALPAEPVPDGLDWNRWVGPAPWRDYNRAYHINPSPGVVPWSFSDAFGVAALTWHLAHSADVIQYALGMENSGPVELIHPSSGQYPTLTCRYANGTLLHFVDNWGLVKTAYNAVPADASPIGLFGGLFIGERGWLTSMSGSGPIQGGPEEMFHDLALPTREVNIGANNHHANFFECIRTRQTPSCPEELGHRTASLGHLAMIAYKLDRSLKWNPATEEFIGDDPANRLRSRAMRQPWHL